MDYLNVHAAVLKVSAPAVVANLRDADIDPQALDKNLIHGS